MSSGLDEATTRMRDAGVNDAAIAIFSDYYRQLAEGATGIVAEETIEPIGDVATLQDLPEGEVDVEAFSRTVIIRLNGGLGTSMGLSKAKTLLPVRDGLTFLDIIVRQVLAARAAYGVRLPLVLLDSFNTRDDTLAALAAYPDLAVDDIPLDMLQSQEPKLRADDLTPVDWPADPRLEWCPPGHGDLYPTLLASGMLDTLLDAGFRYANVANSDNLGCSPDPRLASWFAASGAPFAAEITPRTPMDVKGGHLARRKSDGRLILRETAQTTPEDMRYFTDPAIHPYASTNNLWFDLAVLRQVLNERGGVLGLPLIRNAKTVDPKDASSTPVIQVESAMGAAIEVFDGATAIVVPRSRFLPVKTTNELALLRSDVYTWGPDEVPRATVEELPVVTLGAPYKKIAGFTERMPEVPSLVGARTFDVEGDWTFGSGVVVKGEVTLGDEGGRIADGTVLGAEMSWLVTGGAGYIGAHIVRALRDAGMDAVVIDDLSTGHAEFVPEGVPFVTGTILDRDLVARTLRENACTGVIHVAGFKFAGVSVQRPLHTYEQNVTGMARVLEAMAETGVTRCVFSSSAATYGTPDVDLVTEETPTRPESPYGETKLIGEWLLRDQGVAVPEFRHVALRYFNVVGSATPEVYDASQHNLFPLVIEALRAGRTPRINGDDYPTPDGTCVRDYIHVGDLAHSHVVAAQALDEGRELAPVYNLGSGEGLSVRQIMDTMAEVTGIDFTPEMHPRRPGDPARIVADGSLAARDLDWRMRYTIADMVRTAWEAGAGRRD